MIGLIAVAAYLVIGAVIHGVAFGGHAQEEEGWLLAALAFWPVLVILQGLMGISVWVGRRIR